MGERRSLRSVVLGSAGVSAASACLLLVFGYDGPHMGRMYFVTSNIADLAGLFAACFLLARGRSKSSRLNLLLTAIVLLLMAMFMPFDTSTDMP